MRFEMQRICAINLRELSLENWDSLHFCARWKCTINIGLEISFCFQISLKLRHRRMADGALNFNTGRTTPDPIEDKNSLLSFTIKPYGFSSILVEEFMLLANRTVAKYLSDHLPDQAFVRYHPFPKRNPLLVCIPLISLSSKMLALFSERNYRVCRHLHVRSYTFIYECNHMHHDRSIWCNSL